MIAHLVLLRHGQSVWNQENKFTGWTDVDLSDQGRAEARQAGEKLLPVRIDKAYCSALKRAKETLRIVLETTGQTGLPIDYHEALNERHYGELQGRNKAETAKKFGDKQVHIWRRSYDVAPPGGESLKDTAERVIPYFQEQIFPEILEGKSILISAHGNSLRALVMMLEGLTKKEVLELNIPTGAPYLYDFDPTGKMLKSTFL